MKTNEKSQYILGRSHGRLCECRRRKVTEPVTKGGLAYTPAQMMKMAEQGIPVSMGNASNFDDGVENPAWDVALDQLRGVDPATLWEHQQMVKERLRDGYVKKRAAKQAEQQKNE